MKKLRDEVIITAADTKRHLTVATCLICDKYLNKLENQYGGIPASFCDDAICQFIKNTEENHFKRILELEDTVSFLKERLTEIDEVIQNHLFELTIKKQREKK